MFCTRNFREEEEKVICEFFPHLHNLIFNTPTEVRFFVFLVNQYLEYTTSEMLFEQLPFNSEPKEFYIYHFSLEKWSLMSIFPSFLKLSFRKVMKSRLEHYLCIANGMSNCNFHQKYPPHSHY